MNGHAKRPKRAFEEITIDVWVKVYDFANPHPIMNEDNWDTGDMHFQFWPCDGNGGGYCSGQQGLLIHAINGNTMTSNRYGHTQTEYDYDFQVSTWYYISAQYSSKENFHKLYVNQRMEQTINDAGATTPVTLDSARIGSWMDNRDGNGGNIARSLHGEISVFRIWNIITDGQDVCPPAQTHGLIASYVFGDKADDRLIDLSGNDLTSLPAEIGNLFDLVELRLKDNPKLKKIPGILGRMDVRIEQDKGVSFQMPRFRVGTRVECNVRLNSGESRWLKGKVLQHYWRDYSWPTGQFAPYQVELDESIPGSTPTPSNAKATKIFAPADNDYCIRSMATAAKMRKRDTGHQNVRSGDPEPMEAIPVANAHSYAAVGGSQRADEPVLPRIPLPDFGIFLNQGFLRSG